MNLKMPSMGPAFPLPHGEDIVISYLALALASLGACQPAPDLIEGFTLLGFGFLTVGSPVRAKPAGEVQTNLEVLLWTLVRTGRVDCPKKAPQDHMECLYLLFSPPSGLAFVLLSQLIVDEVLKYLQCQCRITTLTFSQGIVYLEAMVLDSVHLADDNPAAAGSALSSLKDNMKS